MMTAMGYPTHYLDVRPDYKVVCGGSGGPVQKFLSWMVIIYLEFGFAQNTIHNHQCVSVNFSCFGTIDFFGQLSSDPSSSSRQKA